MEQYQFKSPSPRKSREDLVTEGWITDWGFPVLFPPRTPPRRPPPPPVAPPGPASSFSQPRPIASPDSVSLPSVHHTAWSHPAPPTLGFPLPRKMAAPMRPVSDPWNRVRILKAGCRSTVTVKDPSAALSE